MQSTQIQTLVSKTQNGDSEAFGMLYDYLYDRVAGFVYRKVQNKETTKDIVSNVFFKSLQKIHTFQVSPESNFSAWIFKIAMNEIAQYFREQSKYKFVPDTDLEIYFENNSTSHSSVPEHETETKEEQEIMHKCLDQLTESDRNIIQLRYFEDMSYEDIAQILNVSQGSLRVRTHRILKHLKQLFQNPKLNFKPI